MWETSRGNPFFALELGPLSSAGAGRSGSARSSRSRRRWTSSCARVLRSRRRGSRGHPRRRGARRSRVSLVERACGAGFDAGLGGAFRRGSRGGWGTSAVQASPARFCGRGRLTPARSAGCTRGWPKSCRLWRNGRGTLRSRPSARIVQRPRFWRDASRAAYERSTPAAAADPGGARSPAFTARRGGRGRAAPPPPRRPAARRRTVTRTAQLLFWSRRWMRGLAGLRRAEALVRLADVQDDPRATVPLYREALAEAGADDALAATIHIRACDGDGLGRGAPSAGWSSPSLAVTRRLADRRRGDQMQGARSSRRLAFPGRARAFSRPRWAEAMTLERSLAAWPLDRGPTDLFSRQLAWYGGESRRRTANCFSSFTRRTGSGTTRTGRPRLRGGSHSSSGAQETGSWRKGMRQTRSKTRTEAGVS